METAFCYRYIIETKNRTLEETAAIFDGVDAVEVFAPRPVVLGIDKETHEEHEKAGSVSQDSNSNSHDTPVV